MSTLNGHGVEIATTMEIWFEVFFTWYINIPVCMLNNDNGWNNTQFCVF